MGSLTAHLLEAGDHGRLRFHPSCPVCRQERLFGTLSSEPVVSRRAQAVLAGGVLAVSSAAPGAALAVERPSQREGVAAPEEHFGGEFDDPEFDPGGETQLPYETAPVAIPLGEDEVDSGEGAPLDAEPSVDVEGQLAPLSEPEPLATDTPVPPADAAQPVTPAPPGAPDPSLEAVPPGPPVQPTAPAERSERNRGTARPDRAKAKAKPKEKEPEGGAPAMRNTTGSESVPSDTTSEAPAAVAPSIPAAEAVAPAPEPSARSLKNARFHVVEPGDSLWSIAKRLLGPDAAPARIAREVNRLWSLNEARIATGDPDLLMVGTKLRLR
jgi:LysM domain